jgi:hypothetical protein
MIVGAVNDWRGEAVSRAWLPWAMGAGVLFFLVTQIFSGAFAVFLVYEGAAMCAAFGIYSALAVAGTVPGAGAIAIGMALSLVAAVIQGTDLRVHVIVRFDHNALFHVVQIVGVIVLAYGLRISLRLGTGG